MPRSTRKRELSPVGWREWVRLDPLGVPAIKAKVDTGARTSSLHAFKLKTFDVDGAPHVRFLVHPVQRKSQPSIECECPVYEFRKVRSSSGHEALRPVVLTDVWVAGQVFEIELTLANRDQMGFRMLLGREALRRRFLVDSGRSYVGGRP
ncbi:ATP-dependent zinc protease family protein [Posidoniimonas corsicana]|uniref:ATP-dependent zinc protease family protein n=1 Tax=Posidoniimonas corsicana TaxID=1938618 RepID=UPI0011B4FE17|nr:RimK/LysX family protein [Posidoniimonas corsicana]